jgi:hypothetical protein
VIGAYFPVRGCIAALLSSVPLVPALLLPVAGESAAYNLILARVVLTNVLKDDPSYYPYPLPIRKRV